VIRSNDRGIVLRRDNAGFDAAVLGTSNSACDPGRRPDILVQANDVFDVIAAVKQAGQQNLKIAMCSGGHSWAQNHIRNGGMLIDLSRLDSMVIDERGKRAIVGPACLGGPLDEQLAKLGLFFPIAHGYTVGIGGFLLQGGFGWNSRAVGLACESVVGLDIVLADGSLVHASEEENSDLFWAARGAGPGFFGVVVRFHLRLHPRPKFTGLKIQVFRMKHLEEVMRWADRVGREVASSVEFQIVLNRKAIGIFSHGIEVCAPVLAETRSEALEAVSFIDQSPIRSKASFTSPLVPMSLRTMMKSAEKVVLLPNVRWYADNMWIDDTIEPVLPVLRRAVDVQPPAPSHALWLNWNPPAHRPDMAFSVEGRTYLALYGGWKNASDDAQHATWAMDHMRELEPYSRGIQLADENTGRRPARFLSDKNMARLQQIRAERDPQGRFHSWMGHLAGQAA